METTQNIILIYYNEVFTVEEIYYIVIGLDA